MFDVVLYLFEIYLDDSGDASKYTKELSMMSRIEEMIILNHPVLLNDDYSYQ